MVNDKTLKSYEHKILGFNYFLMQNIMDYSLDYHLSVSC